MSENPFFQFVVELVRALLVDVLSKHVRVRLARFARFKAHSYRRALLTVHWRNRQRLLNKLHTEDLDDR
jgi:hypothetical protein